jgi:hypothetical protein
MTDAELAKKLHRTKNGIQLRRVRRKIPKFGRMQQNWTEKEDRQLVKLPDQEIAKRLNCTSGAVPQHRHRLGIPAFANSVSKSFSKHH